MLGEPDGPILLDCKVNADIASPFMGEFAEFETDSTVDQEGPPLRVSDSVIVAAAIS